jgi:hypothetical protein
MDSRTTWRVDASRCWWRTVLDLFWRHDAVSVQRTLSLMLMLSVYF